MQKNFVLSHVILPQAMKQLVRRYVIEIAYYDKMQIIAVAMHKNVEIGCHGAPFAIVI